MQRIPEPELMDESSRRSRYAKADFSEPNERFVEIFVAEFPGRRPGTMLDLGCGPGDIVLRLAQRTPASRWTGSTGRGPCSPSARRGCCEAPELHRRVRFVEGILPGARLPRAATTPS